jgi:hypothetical protein
MTQSNENGSRLDRIEAIMLELATASIRHDNEISRINTTMQHMVEQQTEAAARYNQRFEGINAKIESNTEQIAQLTAGILDLRNLVADYIQSRSQA